MATLQRHLQSLETELRVKAVGELPAEHVPGQQIHDHHQVEESLLQRVVGDVSRPDLVHCRDRADIHKARKALGWIPLNRGAWLLVDRPSTQAVHEVSRPVAADRDPLPGQVVHHPAAAAAGILQVESINPRHEPQGRSTHRCRPVIEHGPGQAQQRTLPADAEIRVVVIDQLAQFTGIRAAETFF
jgi:hypothetical protein